MSTKKTNNVGFSSFHQKNKTKTNNVGLGSDLKDKLYLGPTVAADELLLEGRKRNKRKRKETEKTHNDLKKA